MLPCIPFPFIYESLGKIKLDLDIFVFGFEEDNDYFQRHSFSISYARLQ
jgi:hypothetical protein